MTPDTSEPGGREPGDGELLQQLRAGDRDALDGLYERHAGYVMGIAVRLLASREEAEEVVQEVFWQLWKGHVAYDPSRGRFTTWLYAMARNRSLDRLRRRARRNEVAWVPDEEAIADGNPAEDLDRIKHRRLVQAALAELPPEQRRAIDLAYYHGMTHSEIAEHTQEPIGTIKTRIRRGVMRLREALEKSGVLDGP